MDLFDPLFSSPAVQQLFESRTQVQFLLNYEAALAKAEAAVGLIPVAAAESIVAHCRVELFDLEALAKATRLAGNPVIPLIKALTLLVGVTDASAARYVHWGATSQDVMDTALVLQVRQVLDLTIGELDRLAQSLTALVEQHRGTVMIARTLLQHAQPTSFGLKAAGWLVAVRRAIARIAHLRQRALVLQFGGASGTLSGLGDAGLRVSEDLAARLDLSLPDLPWHTERDHLAEVGTMLGLLAGTLGKIAKDLSLLMQTEVAEAAESTRPGQGGSSAMPHKQNSVGCAVVIAASLRAPGLVATLLSAMGHEHERALGAWHAEWETLPELCRLVVGALGHLNQICASLRINTARMAANLELTSDLVYAADLAGALASALGADSHAVVEELCREARVRGESLQKVAAQDPRVVAALTREQLREVFTTTHHLAAANRLIDRALRQ